jgi:hypothetical protein
MLAELAVMPLNRQSVAMTRDCCNTPEAVTPACWRLRTRCDSDVLELDVIAMTAKGQYLRRGCGPLALV